MFTIFNYKVSIIIPVYNVELYLSKCINSIINQTYKNIEIILINDGSSDNSGTICDEYALSDSRIIVMHTANSGVSAARNNGIDKSTGDYIVFVDSDDWAEINYIESLVKLMNKKDMVICGNYIDTLYNNKFETEIKIYKNTEEISYLNKRDFVSLFLKWMINTPWNKIYISEIIKKNIIVFDISLSLGEDLIFNLQYIDKIEGGFIFINKPLYHYIRLNRESLDNKFYSNMFEIQKKLYTAVISRCKYVYKVDLADVNKLYKCYLNAMLNAMDSYYKNGYKDNVKKLMNTSEFKDTLEYLLINKKLSKIRYYILKSNEFILDRKIQVIIIKLFINIKKIVMKVKK